MSNSTLVTRQRQPVSTLTHSTKQVARHFLAWRKGQKAKLDVLECLQAVSDVLLGYYLTYCFLILRLQLVCLKIVLLQLGLLWLELDQTLSCVMWFTKWVHVCTNLALWKCNSNFVPIIRTSTCSSNHWLFIITISNNF
jgi:hypothetical protein